MEQKRKQVRDLFQQWAHFGKDGNCKIIVIVAFVIGGWVGGQMLKQWQMLKGPDLKSLGL